MTARVPVGRSAAFGFAALLGLLAGRNPTAALAVVFGIAFIGLTLASFPAATGVFIVTTFVNLPDNAAKGIGVLLVLGLLARIATGRDRDLNFSSAHPAATAALVAFLGWTLVGLVWAQNTAAVTTALMRYSLNFVLLFVVFAAVRSRRDLLLLIVLFVIGAAIAAAYGVVHPPTADQFGNVARTGGTLGDPNEFAAVLVIGLLLSAAVSLLRSVPAWVRAGAVGAAVLCLAGIALSVSRGGLLALAVALVVGMLVAGRWRIHVAALTLIVVIGTVGYFSAYASPQALQRITTANGGSGRTDIWTVGWRMFEAHPVRGVGAGNFPVVSVSYLLQPGPITASRFIVDTPQVAHNTYLGVLAEQGIVGAALFLGLLVFASRCYQLAWRSFRRSGDRDLEIVAYALFVGLIGFLAASFFLSEEFSKQLWILIALGPALQRLSATARSDTVGGLKSVSQTAAV